MASPPNRQAGSWGLVGRLARGASLAVLLLGMVACTGGDDFRCQDYCDKSASCDPTLSDREWDDCFFGCEASRPSGSTIRCIVQGRCDEGFEKLVELCTPKGEEEVE